MGIVSAEEVTKGICGLFQKYDIAAISSKNGYAKITKDGMWNCEILPATLELKDGKLRNVPKTTIPELEKAFTALFEYLNIDIMLVDDDADRFWMGFEEEGRFEIRGIMYGKLKNNT